MRFIAFVFITVFYSSHSFALNATCNTKIKNPSGEVIHSSQDTVSGANYGECMTRCNTIARNKATIMMGGPGFNFSCPQTPNPGTHTYLAAAYLSEWQGNSVNLVFRLAIQCYRTLTNSTDSAPNSSWR
jgi:hypothetical protein